MNYLRGNVPGYTLDRTDLEEVLKLVSFCMKQMAAGSIEPRGLLLEMLQIFRSYDAEFFPPNQNLTGIELNDTCSIKESNEFLKKYIDYYWQYDPLYPVQSHPEPVNRVFKTDDVISFSQLKKLRYYREYLRHINWFDELIIRLCTGTGFWGSISLTRSPDQPYFSPRDVRKAEYLLPYLTQTFEATMLFSKINGERQALEQWLESKSEGIILLDSGLYPVFKNEKADTICNSINRSGPGHVNRSPFELPGLVIEDCRRMITVGDRLSCSGNNRIVHLKNGEKYFLRYTPVNHPGDSTVPSHFMVQITPLAKNDDEEVVPVKNYGLSEREEIIARYTGMGLTNKDIGRKLGISPFTVQSHLRNIFEKTGITRRTQLANLVK
ncbi:MAG: helix-turn-helix transcriptional regulator [Dehalococcoidales bacterium]|nr:helix-turn-helix transcriptional regulator [Dehalococcoidales bacterium]